MLKRNEHFPFVSYSLQTIQQYVKVAEMKSKALNQNSEAEELINSQVKWSLPTFP
jgi:hypothetical protein